MQLTVFWVHSSVSGVILYGFLTENLNFQKNNKIYKQHEKDEILDVPSGFNNLAFTCNWREEQYSSRARKAKPILTG